MLYIWLGIGLVSAGFCCQQLLLVARGQTWCELQKGYLSESRGSWRANLTDVFGSRWALGLFLPIQTVESVPGNWQVYHHHKHDWKPYQFVYHNLTCVDQILCVIRASVHMTCISLCNWSTFIISVITVQIRRTLCHKDVVTPISMSISTVLKLNLSPSSGQQWIAPVTSEKEARTKGWIYKTTHTR